MITFLRSLSKKTLARFRVVAQGGSLLQGASLLIPRNVASAVDPNRTCKYEPQIINLRKMFAIFLVLKMSSKKCDECGS